MSQALTLRTFWNMAQEQSGRDFLVGHGRTLGYEALSELTLRIIAAFDEKGLKEGDRVLIVTTNEVAAIGVFLAALLDGKVPVMLAPDTPDTRAVGIKASVEPALVLADQFRASEGWAEGAWLVGTTPTRPLGLFRRRSRPDAETVSGLVLPAPGRSPHLPEARQALAYILFTSGTTSAPTGVMINRGNLLAQLETLSRLFGYTTQSRIFNDLILAHADGLVQGPLLAMANGCALIRAGGFSVAKVEDWLNAVRLHAASHVITVPTVWTMIERYAAYDDYFDGEECVALLSVAARLDRTLWDAIEARFDKPLFNQYGLTETVTSACYAGSHPEMGLKGTIGRPADCEARIISLELGQQPDDTGELQLKGANIFPGYWKNRERTAATFTADGWMRTGDAVRRRPDGSYEFLGRLKTAIMSAGFLIRPEEIDEVLAAHPAIADTVTVGMADPDFEEVPIAAVVLRADADELTLTGHCRAHLEPLKVPKRIVIVPEIPRGPSGKPQLQRLREILLSSMGTMIEEEVDPRDGLTVDVVALAAQVFRMSAGDLGAASSADDTPAWDSFSQIKLILAAEERFGVRISPAAVARIRTLGDLMDAVRNAVR